LAVVEWAAVGVVLAILLGGLAMTNLLVAYAVTQLVGLLIYWLVTRRSCVSSAVTLDLRQ
jgi:hypothetical protein